MSYRISHRRTQIRSPITLSLTSLSHVSLSRLSLTSLSHVSLSRLSLSHVRPTGSDVCPRSGSVILMILTSAVWLTLLIDWGVMKMNCRPTARRAAWMIMCMLLSRLTLSMKTSNSSRHRMGDPMASHSDSNRHTVEYDFSPPESVLVCRPSLLRSILSGCTSSRQQRPSRVAHDSLHEYPEAASCGRCSASRGTFVRSTGR